MLGDFVYDLQLLELPGDPYYDRNTYADVHSKEVRRLIGGFGNHIPMPLGVLAFGTASSYSMWIAVGTCADPDHRSLWTRTDSGNARSRPGYTCLAGGRFESTQSIDWCAREPKPDASTFMLNACAYASRARRPNLLQLERPVDVKVDLAATYANKYLLKLRLAPIRVSKREWG